MLKKIALIFSKKRVDTVGVYVERALRFLNIPFDHFDSEDMQRIPHQYELYFRIADPYCERYFPRHFAPAIYWAADVHLQSSFQHMKNDVSHYEMVFCFLKQGVEKFKPYSKKCYYVSYGCDPEIHRRLNLPKIYDLGFVGTDGGVPRKFILQELKERFPKNYIGLAPYTEMAEIYSQSKIGFNYPIGMEGMTMRSFEIASCGTFHIMPKLPQGWMEELGFQNKKNIMTYESFEELMDLLHYYLKHEHERETIAEAGYEFVRSRHTYQHKVMHIIEHCQKELGILKHVRAN